MKALQNKKTQRELFGAPTFPCECKTIRGQEKGKTKKGIASSKAPHTSARFLTWHGLITAAHNLHLTRTLLGRRKRRKKTLEMQAAQWQGVRRLNCFVLLWCGVRRHPTIPFAGSIFTTSTPRQNFQALTWKNCLTYLQRGPVIYAPATMELLWFVYLYVLTGVFMKMTTPVTVTGLRPSHSMSF